MGNRPSRFYSIERANSDGNYEPENCRWATRLEQNNNRRSCIYIEFDGRRQTMKQWARELGMHWSTIKKRIAEGQADPKELLRLPTDEDRYPAKEWIVTHPSGEEVRIVNLAAFCRDNALDCSTMVNVAKGRRRTHKGYRVRPL